MNKIFTEKYVASISILWIVVMACLVIFKRQTLVNLELNSIGDFLAGAFAPLGFFWLVAGFYQQGTGLKQNSEALKLQAQELKASTEALNLQAEELKNSVQEQKNLLILQQDEIKAKHFAVSPYFDFSVSRLEIEEIVIDEYWNEKGELAGEVTADIGKYNLIVKNSGELARHFSILEHSSKANMRNIFEISKGSINEINFSVDPDEMKNLKETRHPLEQKLIINYSDIYGKRFMHEIEITIAPDAFSKRHFHVSSLSYEVTEMES